MILVIVYDECDFDRVHERCLFYKKERAVAWADEKISKLNKLDIERDGKEMPSNCGWNYILNNVPIYDEVEHNEDLKMWSKFDK